MLLPRSFAVVRLNRHNFYSRNSCSLPSSCADPRSWNPSDNTGRGRHRDCGGCFRQRGGTSESARGLRDYICGRETSEHADGTHGGPSRPPGSQVRLGYMFHSSALGYFPKETVVILAGSK